MSMYESTKSSHLKKEIIHPCSYYFNTSIDEKNSLRDSSSNCYALLIVYKYFS